MLQPQKYAGAGPERRQAVTALPSGGSPSHAESGRRSSQKKVIRTVSRSPADAAELDRLAAFHEAVERLPAEQREAFGLIYYHGWPLADSADLLGVSVRTVQRWPADALEERRRATGAG
jgi:DNA-directed RNA polymerase specialized sigma24 family protein